MRRFLIRERIAAVKSASLRPLYEEALELLNAFSRVKLVHVQRELNGAADEMSNRAIDERLWFSCTMQGTASWRDLGHSSLREKPTSSHSCPPPRRGDR